MIIAGLSLPAGATVAIACAAVCIAPIGTEKSNVETTKQSEHSNVEPYERRDQQQQPEANEATVWDHLADCESGEWDRHSNPVRGTANWASTEHGTFQGGLQFHPDTWRGFKPEGFPDAAYNATREQQIQVGIRVQAQQGWGAWPVCSRKLGLR